MTFLFKILYGKSGFKAPLHEAIKNNNVEIVKLLLTNDKLDVNCKNIYDLKN